MFEALETDMACVAEIGRDAAFELRYLLLSPQLKLVAVAEGWDAEVLDWQCNRGWLENPSPQPPRRVASFARPKEQGALPQDNHPLLHWRASDGSKVQSSAGNCGLGVLGRRVESVGSKTSFFQAHSPEHAFC